MVWSRASGDWLRRLTVVLIGMGAVASARAEERLLDRPPFDQVILDEANRGAVLDVSPLELPERKFPEPRPSGTLTLRWLDRPTETYEVSWDHVAGIRFYEQLLLEEAQRLTAQSQFDEAFDYFARLLADYPGLAGLKEAANDYLRRNALALDEAGKQDRALAVLESLYQRDPKFPGLAKAVDAVAEQLITEHLRQQDYAAARAVLRLWQERFGQLASPTADAWKRRFAAAAERKLSEARELVRQKRYIAARKSIGMAVAVWPEIEGARSLLAEIQQQFRSVVVAVTESSPQQPVRRLDCWAVLRTGRLSEPLLAELVGYGAEGGIYRCPFGELSLDESGRRLTLSLQSSEDELRVGNPLSTDTMTRYVLSLADPTGRDGDNLLAELLAGVSVDSHGSLMLDFFRPHVRPEALLQVPLPVGTEAELGAAGGEKFPAPWVLSTDAEPGSRVFVRTGDSDRNPRGALRAVVEQSMPDDEAAVAALLGGEVDVVDRAPPWQVARLRADKQVHVGTYRLPTVHVLIPNMSKPLVATREFRRALCYGIDRERIVRQVLLGGESLPGFEVMSGPFPAGMSLSDPVRYGYNSRLEPRPYEPRLAAVLATIAWYNILDPKGEGEVELTDIPELVLAYPADPVARIACQTIQLQLGRVGIPIKLREFDTDELLAGRVEYDLRYAELAMWEPVVDAVWLRNPGGQADTGTSSYLDASLRRLDDASNWKDVRASLAEIYEIAHYQLPVVPLWQTANYFAYRTSVQGIGDRPISLYQNIDKWKVSYDERAAETAGR